MKRKFKFFLVDIIESIESISEFIENMDFQNFANDDKTISAVIRKIEIIGEATKNVPLSIREKYTDIPWSDMAKMRDKIIHSYFGLDILTIWNVSKTRFPEMKPDLEIILSEIEDDEIQENLFNK